MRIYANPHRFISWGFGIQSTTLAVMATLGDIEPVEGIVGADTGWEHPHTDAARKYYTDWLTERGQKVYIAKEGDIFDDDHLDGIPYWVGGGGPIGRRCTGRLKIRPVRQKIREVLGLRLDNKGRTPKGYVHMLLGISLDEFQRMRDSDRAWIVNTYPLIDLKLTRKDCAEYLASKGLPFPLKSSCVICPFKDPENWLYTKINYPEEWEKSLEFDRKIRHLSKLMKPGVCESLYIYSKRVPLEEADLEADIERRKKHLDPERDVCDSGYCWI